jgi:lipopolysaccharide/colanic/teichoic acid biosynthesis glycosyltransferase
MKIVITGASGFVGGEIIQYFEKVGADLLLVGRNPKSLATLYPYHSTTDYAGLAHAGVGYDAILHMAVKNNDSTGTDAEFQVANVGLLHTVLGAVREAGIGTFINLTTLHAANAQSASQSDKMTPYARSKRAADAVLAKQTDLRIINLRLPAVYGKVYKGKLAIVNPLPGPLRLIGFKTLAALKPTVHIREVFDTVAQVLSSVPNLDAAQGVHTDIIVTDRQTNNQVYHCVKRLIDLVFVFSVIAFFWWVLVIAWIAVKFSSAGPALFIQDRVGLNGKVFSCYKFRTMNVGTQQTGSHNVDVTVITKVGHFLRRTKIDELPQIWNILFKQMSLIGPRPCLPIQKKLIVERTERDILHVLGGVSGLAQIQNVDMSDPVRLAHLDAEYVKLRTIPLDLKIILSTAIGRGQGDKTRPGKDTL